jgi:hypothetical protein
MVGDCRQNELSDDTLKRSWCGLGGCATNGCVSVVVVHSYTILNDCLD